MSCGRLYVAAFKERGAQEQTLSAANFQVGFLVWLPELHRAGGLS